MFWEFGNKKSKDNATKSYFDMSSKTKDKKFRAAYFSPEKWSRLNKYKLRKNTSYVISSVIKDKETGYKLTNASAVKVIS